MLHSAQRLDSAALTTTRGKGISSEERQILSAIGKPFRKTRQSLCGRP